MSCAQVKPSDGLVNGRGHDAEARRQLHEGVTIVPRQMTSDEDYAFVQQRPLKPRAGFDRVVEFDMYCCTTSLYDSL